MLGVSANARVRSNGFSHTLAAGRIEALVEVVVGEVQRASIQRPTMKRQMHPPITTNPSNRCGQDEKPFDDRAVVKFDADVVPGRHHEGLERVLLSQGIKMSSAQVDDRVAATSDRPELQV